MELDAGMAAEVRFHLHPGLARAGRGAREHHVRHAAQFAQGCADQLRRTVAARVQRTVVVREGGVAPARFGVPCQQEAPHEPVRGVLVSRFCDGRLRRAQPVVRDHSVYDTTTRFVAIQAGFVFRFPPAVHGRNGDPRFVWMRRFDYL